MHAEQLAELRQGGNILPATVANDRRCLVSRVGSVAAKAVAFFGSRDRQASSKRETTGLVILDGPMPVTSTAA